MPEIFDITGLLCAAKRGDSDAESQLYSALYEDLRRLAHQRLRRSNSFTLLQTTALVHETYLRLHRAGYVAIADRAHFLSYAAHAMRSVVVDIVRKKIPVKDESVDENSLPDLASVGESETEILRVHEALKQLANVSERLVKVVEMRYFGGMKESEIADAMQVTERTVRRDWEKARMFLAAALK